MGMEQQLGLASRDDVWRLQTEMKNLYATQAEHADRLSRLEQRQESDPRIKPTWGNQSPFSGIFNGTPQQGRPSSFPTWLHATDSVSIQDPGYNPAAEAFKNFDQDQPTNLIGSLHLDAEDEPRRGASRANSVRFDERALQGTFSHGSRSSTDFLPMRTGSASGSHPLTERSSSHKSEGRQSSAGQSVHSARASSFGLESRPLSATVPSFVPISPPPGLFILGPVPSIIRCWLSTHFTNDSLLYAAVCTGSYKSIIDQSLVSRLGYEEQVSTNRKGLKVIKLSVYLPEATIQHSSPRSSSPAHQLPAITAEFILQDFRSESDSLQIFIGCDTLRARSADIHFSLDRLTLLDDERNKLSVPLVRPENTALYQNLQTTCATAYNPQSVNATAPNQTPPSPPDGSTTVEEQMGSENGNLDPRDEFKSKDPATPAAPSPSVIGQGRRSVVDQANREQTSVEIASKAESTASDSVDREDIPDPSARTESNNVWGSWRRDSGLGNRLDGISTSSNYQRPGRGRGMKVLKPARLNTSRSSSAQQVPASGETGGHNRSPAERVENQNPANTRPPLSATTSKSRSTNPIGGASAFGWLNSGSGKGSTE